MSWFWTGFSLFPSSCSALSAHIIMLLLRDRSSHSTVLGAVILVSPSVLAVGMDGALQPTGWHNCPPGWLAVMPRVKEGKLSCSVVPTDGVFCGGGLLTGPTWSLRSPFPRSRFRSTRTAFTSTWTAHLKNWGGSSLSRTWWIPWKYDVLSCTCDGLEFCFFLEAYYDKPPHNGE